MQDDGNLVIYDATNQPIWASNTNGIGPRPHHLVMQFDRNLVIYGSDGKPTWSTGTNIPWWTGLFSFGVKPDPLKVKQIT